MSRSVRELQTANNAP